MIHPFHFEVFTVTQHVQLKNCTQKLVEALFLIAPTWRQPKSPSTANFINELWYIHSVNYSSKRNELLIPPTMILKIIMLNERSLIFF